MRGATIILIVAVISACGRDPVPAPERLVGDGPSVEDPWLRAAPPAARVMAGYLTLRGAGAAVSVTGVACDGFGRAEIHETVMVDGVAKMRALAALDVPAGERVSLAPGGRHLMLMAPARIPPAGESVACRLTLADGRTVAFSAPVREAGGGDEHAHHNH